MAGSTEGATLPAQRAQVLEARRGPATLRWTGIASDPYVTLELDDAHRVGA